MLLFIIIIIIIISFMCIHVCIGTKSVLCLIFFKEERERARSAYTLLARGRYASLRACFCERNYYTARIKTGQWKANESSLGASCPLAIFHHHHRQYVANRAPPIFQVYLLLLRPSSFLPSSSFFLLLLIFLFLVHSLLFFTIISIIIYIRIF